MQIKRKTIQHFCVISILILLTPLTTDAQNAFRYQAVARDSAGAVLANQLIGVQVSVISENVNLPPVYQEVQQVRSNDYGVINLSAGDGVPLLGLFSDIDWSLKNFLQVELDFGGNTDYHLNSVSEINPVPSALYAERAKYFDGRRFGLYLSDFGVKGDGITDDTDAFRTALDSAAVLGCKVFMPTGVFKITKPLLLQPGVSLIGEGSGSQPLETPYNGSLIWYFGSGFALKVLGHNVRLEDFVIRDKSEEQSSGGILVLANGELLESIQVSEVLISGFTNGTGLRLKAQNKGGIAYAYFNNFRIRHGKIGIHIKEDESSFVNSNTWDHCQISGGELEYGLLVDGGNHNTFNSMVIEPPMTTQGHLFVKRGEISGKDIRIEGVNQTPDVPLIQFKAGTKNSTLTGLYAGGLTLDQGNNFINMKSGKAIHYRNSSANQFRNAVFFSPDGNSLPDWEISGTNIKIQLKDPQLAPKHQVLKIMVPAQTTATLEPNAAARPAIQNLPLYDQVNFGFHVKTNQAGIAYTYTNAPQGWTRSTAHSGRNQWEFVGMNAIVNKETPARFALQIENTTSETAIVFVTTPTLCFGNQLPTLEEQPLYTSGGQLNGLLIHNVTTATIPGDGILDLSLNANYFEVATIGTISRINDQVINRFPRGSIITLLFDENGVGVMNNGYLNLKAAFTSLSNGSLTLMSNGNGTWREVARNN